jgi:hypothetical protein
MINFRFHILAFVIAIPGWIACAGAAEDFYATRYAADLKRCEAISPDDYESGLAFNPDGYRSYYKRSECFQTMAATFRDESLCKNVKERWSLLWSSWAFSEKRCRELAGQSLEKDRPQLEKLRRDFISSGPIRLVDFSMRRELNGRSYGIYPRFEPGYAHRYTLRFDLLAPEAPGGAALLVSYTGPFAVPTGYAVGAPVDDLLKHFPAFTPGKTYRVRATFTFEPKDGGLSEMWSDAFVEKLFPRDIRMQVLEKEIRF